uniref:Secreted protein n=1 Tax=Brugia timori TaxID=42155 RepID=A0A0R3R3R3_9BILA
LGMLQWSNRYLLHIQQMCIPDTTIIDHEFKHTINIRKFKLCFQFAIVIFESCPNKWINTGKF